MKYLHHNYDNPFTEKDDEYYVVREIPKIDNHYRRSVQDCLEYEMCEYKFLVDSKDTLDEANMDVMDYLDTLQSQSPEIQRQHQYSVSKHHLSAVDVNQIMNDLNLVEDLGKSEEEVRHELVSMIVSAY